MTRQFHVFSCHHAFHSDCVVDQLMTVPVKATKLKYLNSQVLITSTAKDEIEKMVGEECLLCNDFMIRTIDIDLPYYEM